MTLGRLALLFIVVPILELVILIRLGQFMGLWPTVALVLLAGFAGAALARLEGMRVLLQFQRELAAGRLPTQAMLDGISVMVGGAFLLTPGILTDVAGLVLLFPPTRRWVQRRVLASLERRIAEGSVRVMTTGPGFGAWSGGDGAGDSTDLAGLARDGSRGATGPVGSGRLDPSKGIVLEPKDG
jgi:UPF0716 protein FxsA